MSGSADGAPVKPPRPCPICKKTSVAAFYPFCSKRCADIDLSRWFGGVYAVPVKESEEDASSPPADDGDD